MKLSIPAIATPKIPSFTLPRVPTFQLPGLRERPRTEWLAIGFLIVYLIACWILFFAIVQPTFNGSLTYKVGADSSTYFQIADALRSHSSPSNGIVLLSLGGNLLGPVSVAFLLKTALWVALLNFGLFIMSIRLASTIPGVNPWFFAVLVSLNAETAVSIVTLNKEIFALFALVLFARYIYSNQRSLIVLLIILLVSLLARWEQVAIVIMFLAFTRKRSYFATRPWLAILLVVMGLSLAYPLMLHSVNLNGFTAQAEGAHTIVILNMLQAHYAYFVAVLPKALMDILGRLVSPSYFFSQYWTGDFHDLQNQFAIHLHELAMLVICVATVASKRWTLKHPIPFFIALYLVVTAINPFVQPRYEYPVYVLLCLELARRTQKPTAGFIDDSKI